MPAAFRYHRRVQFYETDLAGIVHFSWYFRYMEEAEHALWRHVGLSIAPVGATIGFPRVASSCDFTAPLKFEDEFDVDVRVDAMGKRSIRYAFTLTRGDVVLATGTMTSACVSREPGQPVRSIALPSEVVARLG